MTIVIHLHFDSSAQPEPGKNWWQTKPYAHFLLEQTAISHPDQLRWLMHKWLKCKILHTVLPWFMQMDVGKFFPHSKCGSHTHLHFLITHDNCSQMLFRILLSQILYFMSFSIKRSKNDLLSVTVGRYLNLPTYIMPRTNCFSICDSIWYHSLPTFFSLEFRQKNVLKCLHFLFI